MTKRILFSVLVLMCVAVLSLQAQREPKQVRKSAKSEAQKRAEQKSEDARFGEYSVNLHGKHQDKATKKRMKASSKRSKRHNNNRREFFLSRWYKNATKKK